LTVIGPAYNILFRAGQCLWVMIRMRK